MISDKKLFYSLLTAFFATALVIGSFFDLEIATAVYLPKNPPALFVTFIELYFFHAVFVFLIGILLGQFFLSGINKNKRILCSVICGYLALSTSVLGAGGLLSASCYGEIFGRREFSFFHFLIIGIIIFYPLFFIGFFVGKKRYDKNLIKKIIILLSVLTISYFIPIIFKEIICRPRYRIVSSGYNGIDFTPWYSLFRESDFYQKKYSLMGDDFGSFFSGHAVIATMNFIIFPIFNEIFPTIKNKTLFIISVTMMILTVLSRMVLGAHYLSDISFGVLVGTLLCIVYHCLEKRIIKKEF